MAVRSNEKCPGVRTLFTWLTTGRINDGRNKAGLVVSFEFADGPGARYEIPAFVTAEGAWVAVVEELCGRR